MRKRLTFCVSAILAIALAVGPLLAAATSPPRRSGKSSKVERIAGAVNKPSKLARVPFSSKFLSKRPAQVAANSFPGQTSNILPDGRLLKTGGTNEDGPLATVVIQDPRGGDNSATSIKLQRARAWHTSTMLPDGNVLIVGGIGASGAIEPAVELLNPETGVSQTIESSGLTPRVYHSATLLTEGLVLIAGGLSNDGKILRTAQLWDFRSKAVTSVARLRTPRYNHNATLLPSGRVLFTGGSNDDGLDLQSSELYVPTTQRFAKADLNMSEDLRPSTLNPRLSGSLPENGATGVPIDSFIALRFSKRLRVDTLNAETVVLGGVKGQVVAKVVPAEGGMLAFVTPSAPLLPGLTYTVSIAGSADPDGSAVQPATVEFTTMFEERPRGRVWVPSDQNFEGIWTSGLPHSYWQDLNPYEAASGVTALSGQVLRVDGWPLEKVKLQIGESIATTDYTGRFLLSGVEAGRKTLIVDCRPANTRKETYGFFMIAVDVPKSNATNVLPFTIWMPVLDTKNAIQVKSPTKKEVVATTPLLPGLEVHIPPDSILRDVEGNSLTSITITPVPVDRGPFPGPVGVKFPMFFTLQLGGTKVEPANGTVSPGMKLVFPNYEKVPAGTRIVFWSYAADGVGWYTYGNGTVTADGKQIVPDPGVTINLFTCASIGTPDEPVAPPPCNGCSTDGDPVDLSTGLFVYRQTDLVLPDVIPISLTRVYRPNDPKWRPFGSGTRHPYEMFLVGDQATYTYAQLILPDGGKIRFDRISPGTGLTGAIMECVTSPTSFYKAKLQFYGIWSNGYWDLKVKDGTTYRFPVDGRDVAPLSAIIDRNGNQLSVVRTNDFTVNLQGHRITRLISPNGRWVVFTYDANFHITQAKDNIGRTVNYTYDGSGRLTQVTDAGGGVTQYTYDTANRMLTIRDARGIVYLTNQYDTNGRVTLQTQADATTYQFAYTLDGNGKVTQTNVTDPRGNIRQVNFNSDGYTISDTRMCCGGLAYTFERQTGTDFVLSVTDPLNRRTEYAYDSMGNVTSVTRMAGISEAVTTGFAYESSFNQVASVTDPLNHTTAFAYDSKGNLTGVTDALNHQTTFSYNSAGQPISATDPLGNTAQFAYYAGDLVSVTNPLGQTAARFVDAAGRVMSVTNPLGQAARFEYDALNRMTRVTDPLQGVTQFSYDPNGNLLSLTDARNNVTSYVYDNMDRVQTRTDPLNHAESFQYNQNGSLTQRTDRKSQVTNYAYDSLDRLSQVTYADASTITYAYDAVSRLTQATDSISGTITYAYDNLDRLLSETPPQGTVSYTYDALGRRATMTVPAQSIVNYSYDNANRLTQITQGSSTVTFAYDAADRRTALTLPNGVVTEYSYDNASRLTALTYKKSNVTLGNLSYGYDGAGRRTQIGGSFARTGLPSAVTTTNYNAANQQTTFGSQSLAFDLNGNLTSDGSNTYVWNARNQLISITGSVTATFQYDAVARRRTKTIASVTTSFLYDGDNVVQEQSGGTANILTGGIDEFFSRSESAGTSSLISEALGSVIALTDSAGIVQTQYTYEPFGTTSAGGTASSNTFQHNGRENDGTGLYYYRTRYYSPSLHRFLSSDSLGFHGGDVNLYGYVANSPLNFRDPQGTDLVGLTGGVSGGGAVGGLGIVGTASYMVGINTSGRKPKVGGAGSFGISAGPDYRYPKSREPSGGLGAGIGAGGGLFWSNAKSFCELAGPFHTTFVSTPWFGLEIDNSGPIYIVSITLGKGWGAGIFHLETQTPKWSTWETCIQPPPLPYVPILH